MRPTSFAFLDTGGLSAFDSQAADLQDPRPHPTEAALSQLGSAIMAATAPHFENPFASSPDDTRLDS